MVCVKYSCHCTKRDTRGQGEFSFHHGIWGLNLGLSGFCVKYFYPLRHCIILSSWFFSKFLFKIIILNLYFTFISVYLFEFLKSSNCTPRISKWLNLLKHWNHLWSNSCKFIVHCHPSRSLYKHMLQCVQHICTMGIVIWQASTKLQSYLYMIVFDSY